MVVKRKASIFIGYDAREADAFSVAMESVKRRLTLPIPVNGLFLDNLQTWGLYRRPTEVKINANGRRQLIDVLSMRDDYDGSMSTEFAISRFLVPHLAGSGLAMFMDSDMLARGNLVRLFTEIEANPGKALYCVNHDHRPTETVKMDGQLQTSYPRKNQSSMMVFDCDHPANNPLTVDLINAIPGRDLHRFIWVDDSDIGYVGAEWNYLVGHTFGISNPQLVHFTDGIPSMPGYENVEYADEWRSEFARTPCLDIAS